MTDSFDPQNDFDAFYYAIGCGSSYDRHGHWLGFFQGIADQIIADLHPKNVLDAGCAKGFLVEGLRNRGVEAWGIDISEYAIQEVFDTIKPYCKVGSITDPFPQKYDLIVTIEVVEHMAAEMGKKAIANMCAHTDRVLFSSTPFDYKETTHFNVQPPEYWAREFARHGFFRDVDFDASFITSWAVCFKKVDLPLHQLTYDYERRFWPLALENAELRLLSNELRKQVQGQELQVHLLRKIIQVLEQLDQEAVLEQDQPDMDANPFIVKLEQLIATNRQLRTDLYDRTKALHAETLRADEYQKRWEALEGTRTWEILTVLKKFRSPGPGRE